MRTGIKYGCRIVRPPVFLRLLVRKVAISTLELRTTHEPHRRFRIAPLAALTIAATPFASSIALRPLLLPYVRPPFLRLHLYGMLLSSSNATHAGTDTRARARTHTCIVSVHASSKRITIHASLLPDQHRPLVSPGSMVPYVWGDDNSSECPDNFLRITTEEGCRAAAVAKGKLYKGTHNASARPAGCHGSVSKSAISVWLNIAPVGAGYPDRPLLCAGAPLAHQPAVCHANACDPPMLILKRS